MIYRRICHQGYGGGYTILRSYIQPKRQKRKKAVVRFEIPPGDQLQHDWGVVRILIGGERQTINLTYHSLTHGVLVRLTSSSSVFTPAPNFFPRALSSSSFNSNVTVIHPVVG